MLKKKQPANKHVYLTAVLAVLLALLWAVPVLAADGPAGAGTEINGDKVHNITITDVVSCSDQVLEFTRDFTYASDGSRFYFADMKIAEGTTYAFAPVKQDGWRFEKGDVSGTAGAEDLNLRFYYNSDLSSDEITYDYADSSYVPETRYGIAARTLQFQAKRDNGYLLEGVTLRTESPVALGIKIGGGLWLRKHSGIS